MGWQFTSCVDTYAESALPFLRQRPAEHTVQLTVIENLHAGALTSAEPALFGWWTDDTGAVRGTCSHTPPYNMVLTDLPGRAPGVLARELHDRAWRLTGVMGPADIANRFATLWAAWTDTTTSVSMRQRLYRLSTLREPDPSPPGAARRAGSGDRDVLIRWFAAFARESGAVPADDVSAVVDDRVGYGGVVLWERGDVPVAFAVRSRTAAGMARIGPVYTPHEHRQRGYGATVTAAASRASMQAGASEVVLFTDLANPTSNAVYQRIGFEPVSDRLAVSFSPGGVEEA